MRKSRFNLLAKLLISYIFVLLCPVIIILFYYYPYSTDIVKEKEMDWNAHITEQVMNSMDIFTSYAYNLPFELVNNREIKLYMAEDDDYQRLIIAGEMRKYNATDAFIDNTFLYVKKIGFFFSKTGSGYSIQDFEQPGLGYYYENWPAKAMIQELNTLTKPAVRPAENVIVPGNNQVRMLTFLLPLPVGGINSPGAVMIMVSEQTMIRLMKSVSEAYNGDFFIFDGKGNRLVASNHTTYSDSSDFNDVISRLGDHGSSSGIYEIDGKSYILTYNVSDKNGWKYVSLMPVSETLQDIRKIQRNTVILVILILILEVIVIYVSIRKNYHPIKKLVHFAKNVFTAKEPDTLALNEIDTIRYALDELFSVNSQLDERVKSTLPIMRENLLYELVNGHYLTWDDFLKDAAPYEVFFNHSYVTVAVLSCEMGDESNAAAEGYCRMKENNLPEGLQGYFFNSIYNREIVFVCSQDRGFQLKAYLVGLQQELDEIGIRTIIGIGAPEECPEGVHLSYLQAVRAAEHLRVRNQYAVLVFNEIEVHTYTVSYFVEQLQSLELFILKNDVDAIQSVVERIIDYIRSDGAPPHIVRAVYLNTVTVIFNGLQRFRQDDQNLLKSTDVAFTHRYTIEQMVQIMRESCCKLCDLIRAAQPPSRSASVEEVLAFIEKKGMDPDFSLQLIADHFNMSISNFSHYFKRITGQNFKDYVNRYRIQTSIELLRRSDETLESIALKAGYSNTSSFIRSFKKLVGVTPGQYRESNRSI